jgi:hypothetical protein
MLHLLNSRRRVRLTVAVRATYDLASSIRALADGDCPASASRSARRYARRTAHEVQVEALPVTFSDGGANTGNNGHRDAEALRQTIRELPTKES